MTQQFSDLPAGAQVVSVPQQPEPDQHVQGSQFSDLPAGAQVVSVPNETTTQTNADETGAFAGVKRAVSAVLGLPGAVYHAAVDAPRNEEETQFKADESRGFGLDSLNNIAGQINLAGKRLITDAMVETYKKGRHLEDLADKEQDPQKKQALLHMANGYIMAAHAPLVGPLAAQLVERGEYGDMEKGFELSKSPFKANPTADPWGALAEGLTYALTPKAIEETKGLAKAGIEAGLRTADNLRPTIETVGRSEVPSLNDSMAARAARILANREDLQRFNVQKVQPAVREATGNLAEDLAHKVVSIVKPEYDLTADAKPILNFNDAADSVEGAAKQTYQKLDDLGKNSEGLKFSDMQRAERHAWNVGDMEAVQKYRGMMDSLMDANADKFAPGELDQARVLWTRAQAMRDIHAKITSSIEATNPKFLNEDELDQGYIKPKKLSDGIVKMRLDGRLADAGMEPTQIKEFQDLANILRKNEISGDRLNNIIRLVTRKGVGALAGGIVGGPLGAGAGIATEAGAEWIAGKALARIMTDSEALETLNAGLRASKVPVATVADKISDQLKRTVGRAYASTVSVAKRLVNDESGELRIPSGDNSPGIGVVENPETETPNAPTFYSKAERVANEKAPNNASGEQVLSTLRNNGVKESEIGWMGLDDFLKGRSNVSKDDLMQFIKENQIQLDELNRGTPEQRQLQQLSKQRNELYAENNRIWSDDLRYSDDAAGLFNAMKQGSDLGIRQTISRMPEQMQEPARRFVETDRQLRDLDDQISKLQYQLDNSGLRAPKCENYTLPGEKENYTEKLLTLPDQARAKIDELNARLSEMANRPASEHAAHPEWKDEWDAIQREKNALLATPGFRGPHFEEPNVLAHVRYDVRPTVDGGKTLFLEEVQSDWHQKGKQQGYTGKPQQELEKQIADLRSKESEARRYWTEHPEDSAAQLRAQRTYADLQDAMQHYNGSNKGVPDAPFKSDWHELVMKRMLREAAEKGFDSLSWTTGEQQAARYDLSKQIGEVSYDPEEQALYARDHSGKEIIHETGVTPEELADYIGKEPAAKLQREIANYNATYDTSEWSVEPSTNGFVVRDPNGDIWYGRDGKPETFESKKEANEFINAMAEQDKRAEGFPKLTGLDLKIGGEWANALYDRAIPNFLNKYAKKWNGRVGETQLAGGKTGGLKMSGVVQDRSTGRYQVKLSDGDLWGSFGSEADARKAYNDEFMPEGIKVHSIQITPAMHKSLLKEGQPIAENKPEWADGAALALA